MDPKLKAVEKEPVEQDAKGRFSGRTRWLDHSLIDRIRGRNEPYCLLWR